MFCFYLFDFLQQTGYRVPVRVVRTGTSKTCTKLRAVFDKKLDSEWTLMRLFEFLSEDITQQAHNIKMTSYQRRCDVILTLCAYWVVC